jgi:hypothetical protein
MSARVVAILVVLLVVLGGAALLLQREDAAQRPQNAASLGRPLLKDLKAAEVTKIRIVEPKATLTLVRKEEGWAIEERAGFPADLAKVREFVIKLLELKVGQSEPIGEADRARLNLDDPANKSEAAGTRLELASSSARSTSAARSTTPRAPSPTAASSACRPSRSSRMSSPIRSRRRARRAPTGSTAPPSRWRR